MPGATDWRGNGNLLNLSTRSSHFMQNFSLLQPLLKIFLDLPMTLPSPLSPPLTHVIHSLVGIPVNCRLYPTWFPELPPSECNPAYESLASDINYESKPP